MEWEIVLLEPVDRWFMKLCESDPASAALIEQALDSPRSVPHWADLWSIRSNTVG
ncbi:hypothetical protein ACWF82_11060 [Nocardia sp. NPDC055053]